MATWQIYEDEPFNPEDKKWDPLPSFKICNFILYQSVNVLYLLFRFGAGVGRLLLSNVGWRSLQLNNI